MLTLAEKRKATIAQKKAKADTNNKKVSKMKRATMKKGTTKRVAKRSDRSKEQQTRSNNKERKSNNDDEYSNNSRLIRNGKKNKTNVKSDDGMTVDKEDDMEKKKKVMTNKVKTITPTSVIGRGKAPSLTGTHIFSLLHLNSGSHLIHMHMQSIGQWACSSVTWRSLTPWLWSRPPILLS